MSFAKLAANFFALLATPIVVDFSKLLIFEPEFQIFSENEEPGAKENDLK